MCDTISTSIVLGALALVPGSTSRYVFLALTSASFIFFAAHHQGPVQKLTKLEDAIEALEEILERAKATSSYARNHMKIQSNLLEMSSAKTYFKSIRAILHTIDQCAKELIIEEERQRKLTEGIKESQEVLDAVVLRRAYCRSESDSHIFQSYKYRVDQSQPSPEELSSIP
ncbi:hypothetical protein B0H13DRAFT_1884795 [Mycena leptocephala]|nr:hypothetical protein B0H13DRAFT_1884795 [Mycena leptocephala]